MDIMRKLYKDIKNYFCCLLRNVLTFVDGAHALGSLPLNISELNPDFYVSNAHKWLASAKGCAFLYVRRDLQDKVRPAVVSHGLGSGFNSEFVWTGLFFLFCFCSIIKRAVVCQFMNRSTLWNWIVLEKCFGQNLYKERNLGNSINSKFLKE